MPIGRSWLRHLGRRARVGVTRGGTTASFWKRFIILRFTTSPGGRCRRVRALEQRLERFWRLSQRGVFEAMLAVLAAMSGTAHLVQMVDSTIVRAHVSAAGAKGGSRPRRSAARVAG